MSRYARILKRRNWVVAVGLLGLPAMACAYTLPKPYEIDAGPLGRLGVQGVVSAFAFAQNHPQGAGGTLGAKHEGLDLSNALVIVQKDQGLVQFYLEGGAYNYPTLASGFSSTSNTLQQFGALPIAYLSIVPNAHFSLQVGKLPSLIGVESGFTYENIDIERGLLWNVAPNISRGVQLNGHWGALTASLAWTDGYYSDRFNNLSGALSYALDAHNSISFYGGGNLGRAGGNTSSATGGNISDGADDSAIYGLSYSYDAEPWALTTYVQYMHTPRQPGIGLTQSFHNLGVGVLGSYHWTSHWSLGGRVEYLEVSGSGAASPYAQGITNLPGDSHAWSLTLTPSFRQGAFFARAEFSYVCAFSPSGQGFAGPRGKDRSQTRGLLETGLLF